MNIFTTTIPVSSFAGMRHSNLRLADCPDPYCLLPVNVACIPLRCSVCLMQACAIPTSGWLTA